MAGNRKDAEKFCLEIIDRILPGGDNVKIYKDLFSKMSDADFDELMKKIESEDATLFLVRPNLSEHKVKVLNNIAIAKELGHEFFQRLWLTDPITNTTYLTPIEYLVVDLPLRRQIQLLSKKISIPEDNKHVDELSGQATGPSKGSKISFPELQVLYAQGLNKCIEETMVYRGGDIKKFNSMNKQIIETGGVRLSNIQTGTRTKSVNVLSTLLKAMHLDNNL